MQPKSVNKFRHAGDLLLVLGPTSQWESSCGYQQQASKAAMATHLPRVAAGSVGKAGRPSRSGRAETRRQETLRSGQSGVAAGQGQAKYF